MSVRISHRVALAWKASALAALTVAGALPARATATTEPNACALLQESRTDDLIDVPFRTVDGRIYVEARIDGKGPFPFAIDTGASGMGRADASLTDALALPVARTGKTSDGVSVATVDMTHFQSLELGGFARQNIDVITRDYSSKAKPEAAISGIIGRAFFADGLLLIDYPSHRVAFTRTRSLSRGDAGVLAYDRAFRVPVSIGTLQTKGNVDTGANVTFVLPKSLFDHLPDTPLEKAGDGTLTNSRIESSRATIAGPFRIGLATIANTEVRVSDRYPELLVGAHVLQNFALLIDQRSKSLALCPPPQAAAK